ncbi:MAG TPA: hypothetical protein VNZ47_16110 [Candidatus Dormibacteraeota bacterium]|nr:hypothetical protein [Candidatus Dormibacteraeota bacterium]
MASNTKFFSPRFLLPMAAVLLLVGSFFFYYFLIISRQEAALDDRSFRSLAAVSAQLRDLVGNYAEVMQRAPKREDPAEDEKFRAFVAEQVPDLKVEDKCPVTGPSIRPIVRDDGDALQFVVGRDCAYVRLETALAPLLSGTSRQMFDEMLLTNSKGRVLYQTQTADVLANDLSSFLQAAQGGSQPKSAPPKSDSAPDNKTAAAEKDTPYAAAFLSASQSSNLVTISVAGTLYRAYLVPVPLATSDPGQTPEKTVLVLCGLIRQDKFRSAGRSVPGILMTTLVLTVLLVIVATWPLLKFSTMRLTERVPRNAGLYYALSATATIVMLIVLVIDLRYVFYDPETDANLKSLEIAIDSNLGRELRQALRVLDGIAYSNYFKTKDFADHTKTAVVGCTPEQKDKPSNTKTDVLKLPGMQLAEYPYFRRVYAYDSSAFEQMKWTVDPTEPPSLRVCARSYFNDTIRNQLWYLKDDIAGPRFRVEPIYSRLSGEFLAVIAEPAPASPVVAPETPRVLTMVTPLLSLIHPVLPPDYGFAVIDEAGKVLFHSDAAKNGRENFFDESSNSGELRSAITARRQTWLTVNYSGVDHRVFISPFSSVQHSPWYLITFSNLATAGTDRVERLVLFSALVLIYFAVVIVPTALILMLLRANRVLWIWPTEEKLGSYYHLILTLSVVMLLFYSLTFRAGPSELLVFSVVVPILSVLLAFFKLTSRDQWISWAAGGLALSAMVMVLAHLHPNDGRFYFTFILICAAYFFLSLKPVTERLHVWASTTTNGNKQTPQRKEWAPTFLTTFSLACFCLLVMAAAPPCIALFKSAYDHEENMSTRREQLLTMQALEARENRVIQQYFNVQLSDQKQVYADDLAKWLFLRRRLEDEKLDVYDTIFPDQQTGQVFKPGAPARHKEPPQLLNTLAANLPFSHGSLTSRLSQNAAELSQWEWDNEGTNRIRVHPNYDPAIEHSGGSPQTLALAKLVFNDPVFLTQELAYDLDVLQPREFFVLVAAPLFLLLIGMYFSVRSTLKKMFLINMKMPDALPEITLEEAIARNQNLILLSLPCSERSKALKSRKDVSTIDLVHFIHDRQGLPKSTGNTVALDHFEVDMDDDAANEKKLELVDHLVRSNKTVLIITTIDPMFYLESAANGSIDTSAKGSERSRTLQRWGRLLEDFTKFRLKGEAMKCSKACYSILWSSFTRNEQAAFYGLARDGWANHKNHAALEHLLLRGLIRRTPMFEIAPECADFAEYIKRAVTREERESWDVRHAPEFLDWDGLRVMFIILLTGTVAAVLFFSHFEVLGYITSAISVVLPLAKLLTDVRSGRGATATKTDGASA